MSEKIFKALGITGHEDLGIHDGFYLDRVWVNEDSFTVKIPQAQVKDAKNPAECRFNILKCAIEAYHSNHGGTDCDSSSSALLYLIEKELRGN